MAADIKTGDAHAETAAEFFRHLIRIVQAHQAAVTHSTLVTASLLQAIVETFPEVGTAYAQKLAQAERGSPLAETSRRISAELDRLIAKMKD
jgi:hypothetical protein